MPRDFGCLLALALATAPAIAVGAAQPSALPANQRAPVTFTRDIAPILFEPLRHLPSPGRTRAVQPADLSGRQAARDADRGRDEEPRDAAVEGRARHGEFVGQQPLSDAEIARIQRWVVGRGGRRRRPRSAAAADAGPTAGSSASPICRDAARAVHAPAEGTDVFRDLRPPASGVGRLRYVQRRSSSVPATPRVVHHANIRIDRTPASRRLDEQDPAPGYDGLIAHSAVYPDGHFLGWTPGQVAPLLPNGLAWRLEPGTDLVVEAPHAAERQARSRRSRRSASTSPTSRPTRTPAMLRLGRQNIDIPAGRRRLRDRRFVRAAGRRRSAGGPAARALPRARGAAAARRCRTARRCRCIYIKDWDFRWQHVYRYVTPSALPKGTTLSMRYTYDNSAANPRNPQQPPRRVHWGQRSTRRDGRSVDSGADAQTIAICAR